MGELLPGWRQQDLLGAARPGLLKKERKMSWRVNKDLKVRKKETKKNSQLPCNDMSKSLFIIFLNFRNHVTGQEVTLFVYIVCI